VPTADISADSNLQPGRYERSTPSEKSEQDQR